MTPLKLLGHLVLKTDTLKMGAYITKSKPFGDPTHLEACPLESLGPRTQAFGVHPSHPVSASTWVQKGSCLPDIVEHLSLLQKGLLVKGQERNQ